MSLGRREARHQTVAAARTAGVKPEDYWDFKPGQKVMTADGFPGVVAAVDDGPSAGMETYEVTLDNGMGGGQYTASLLKAMPQATANVDVKTAADDYPELGSILEDRPPLQISIAAALTTQARDTEDELHRGEYACQECDGSGELPNGHECDRCDASGIEPKHGAYDHGDPDTYTASHKCPNCASERALESADGMIKCEDCGYEQSNGQKDGWSKTSALEEQVVAHILDRAKQRAKEFHQQYLAPSVKRPDSPPGTANLSVDIRPLYAPPGSRKPKVKTDPTNHGRVASADVPEHDAGRFPHGSTCIKCGFSHWNAPVGSQCLICGGQMSKQPDKYGHTASLDDPYRMLVEASTDPEFRFHITASFADVRSKAKRLRAEGKVNIISVGEGVGTIVANVKGDHAVYETEIVRQPGKSAVAQWHCGCKWGAYAWGRQGAFKKFEGRLCSHALALHFEAQSQGMFGRSVTEEEKSPGWLKPRTRVVVDFDRDTGKNVSRPAQPRKRDLMRTHAKVQPEQSPVATLVAVALADGDEMADILVALSAVGIDGRSLFGEAKKLPGSDPDKKHHRHVGDQAPCARAGCGHPEGIHGDNGATCLSAGCDCRKFTTVPSQPSDKDNSKDSKQSKDNAKAAHLVPEGERGHHRDRISENRPGLHGWGGHGDYFPLLGAGYGWGYGGGYGADADGDNDSGSDNDSGGADGGGSDADDGGGMGSTGSKTAASIFPDTMDPTYTPGNEPRPHDGANGVWGATTAPNPNNNPASTGWATSGDPDEFKVDSSAFGRMGSLSKGWTEVPSLRQLVGQVIQIDPKTTTETPAWAKDLKVPNTVPDWMTGGTQAPAKPTLPSPRSAPVEAPTAPKPVEAPKPGGGLWNTIEHGAQDAGKAVGEAAAKGEAVDATGGGPENPIADGLAVGTTIGDLARHIPGVDKYIGQPLAKPLEWADNATGGKVGDVLQGAADLPGKAWHSVENLWGGGNSKPAAAPSNLAGGGDWSPVAVPASPGTAKPEMPDPHEHGAPNPQLAPAPTGQPSGQAATTGLPAGSPSNSPAKGLHPDNPPGGAGPNKAPKTEEEEGTGKNRGPGIPPLPGIPTPDYYRASDAQNANMGIGSMSALVNDLLRQEAALDAQAELHPEPEAALPQTDGDAIDPDGDVEGMASHGSLETAEPVDNEAVASIVAQFQATAGAAMLVGSGGSTSGGGEDDVAAAAKAFLQTEAMKTFSPSEQKQIIDEGMDVTAANLDRLNIEGTHYEALEAALASQTDDDDLEF